MIVHRHLDRDEFDTAVEWAAAEGWNPGLGDADAFWAADPQGFVGAVRDGEVVATGSIVSYEAQFGFMGFFIVRPDLRGQGIGRDLWFWRRDTLLARLRPGAAIGMDGVIAMQGFYADGGFELAHRTARMTWIAQEVDRPASVVAVSSLPFEAVARFDRRHFGCPRHAFLRHWLTLPGGLALATTSGDEPTGLGVLRPCQEGFKVGPLFADDEAIAETLLSAMEHHAAGQRVFIDVPEVNPGGPELAARHGMTEVFGCARMYLGPAPDLPWSNIYGSTTFELG